MHGALHFHAVVAGLDDLEAAKRSQLVGQAVQLRLGPVRSTDSDDAHGEGLAARGLVLYGERVDPRQHAARGQTRDRRHNPQSPGSKHKKRRLL